MSTLHSRNYHLDVLTLFQRFTLSPRRLTLLESWAPLAILILAAVLRLYNLGFPQSLNFDETYYVKDAFALLNGGYERDWNTNADENFEAGNPAGLLTAPSFVVHPPLGKWLIGLGMLVFGAGNPFGWRIVVALLGIATVWLILKSAKLIFNSSIWALVAGFLMAIDGVGIVLSRTALLDQILGFFVILGFYFLVKDRKQVRIGSWNRPWLIAMGAALGCATAVKWSGLYFVAAFTLYVILSEANLNYRIQKGVESKLEDKLPKSFWVVPSTFQALRNGVLVAIPALLTYLVSWSGWFLSKGAWNRNWADQEGNALTGFFSWIPTSLQSFWHYHVEIYNFHINLSSSHPYESKAITWLFMLKPTAFFWEDKESGCLFDSESSDCVSTITSLGNPFIWWAAILAISVLAASWFRTRDKTTTLLALGLFAGFVPWLLLPNRTMFEFYVIAFSPWIMLLLTAGLRAWFQNSEKPKTAANWIAGYLILAALGTAFFFPIWSGMWISYDFWQLHMWLPSWI
jgi:dolichyl-phosphate-mannose--protein O-mannosyl transferase